MIFRVYPYGQIPTHKIQREPAPAPWVQSERERRGGAPHPDKFPFRPNFLQLLEFAVRSFTDSAPYDCKIDVAGGDLACSSHVAFETGEIGP